MPTNIIKIFHGFREGQKTIVDFLSDVQKTMTNQTLTFGIHFHRGELLYSIDANPTTYASFESQFYTDFNDFQIIPDRRNLRDYDSSKTVVGQIFLENGGFFPFGDDKNEDSGFIDSIMRTLENSDISTDKLSYVVQIMPLQTESILHFLRQKFDYRVFKWVLRAQFPKYMMMRNLPKNWKKTGHAFFDEKRRKPLFATRIAIVAQSSTREAAKGKMKALFNKFMVLKNIPYNQFLVKTHQGTRTIKTLIKGDGDRSAVNLTADEISEFFHFPSRPDTETSLLTVKSKKLGVPVGVPSLPHKTLDNGEIIPVDPPREMTPLGISDYRSTRVPLAVYDEDRLRHTYVIGKTGTGKSKFLLSLMIRDIQAGKGIGVIDPHGDLVNELITHIPPERKEDVIIFDPTDDQYPFCLNPLDVGDSESKQILAKGFIDIFNKFFGSNWNAKLEHVLRMIFLALLDKPDSTLFDIIRALTDKDFRYDMIDAINDDVVRNFWTNEFAGWSQQFNTEAIMPILNKVGQLLSVDILKNIFASPDNKLDFRAMMDESKILLVKLPKGKLQEDIMGFLGAMFVTKIFQASMSRQNLSKSERIPFFLYVDEFQNFATSTFSEILSEARKYGLGLSVAHQFIKQIPQKLSDSLFGNVGTLMSFRISSEDALYMQQHFSPYLTDYDIANLNIRELYCKTIVQGQVKDPFSLKTLYTPDAKIDPDYIQELYHISRSKYSRSLTEAKKAVSKQADVVKKVESFVAPLL